MLELRPNCELCDCDLPPASSQAMICSYECTYCESCVKDRLFNVCPTCGGGFTPRPIRPSKSWRPDYKLGLDHHPAGKKRVNSPYASEDVAAFVAQIRALDPVDR